MFSLSKGIKDYVIDFRITVKQGEEEEYKDLAEPFSNDSPLNN